MKKNFRKITAITAMLLAVVIAISGNYVIAEQLARQNAAQAAQAAQTAAEAKKPVSYAHGVTVDENGDFVFTYNGKKYKNEYERLIAEDGFIYGVDWNWFSGYNGGMISVGDNDISGYKSQLKGRAKYIRRSLINMKAIGLTAVNVWITMTDGGIVHDEDGYCVGLNDSFKENLIILLDVCREVGMDIVPAILAHGDNTPFQLGKDGMTCRQLSLYYQKYYYDKEARETYLNNVVDPICKMLSDYQDIIPIMGVTIENTTYKINDPDLGMIYGESGGTTWSILAELVNGIHDVCKKYMPDIPTSVEDVGWPDNAFRDNNGLKVDLVGMNYYSASGVTPDLKERFINKPSYIGEYNVGETVEIMKQYSTEKLNSIRVNLLESAVKKGFMGAFYFNWMTDEGGIFDFFTGNTADNYSEMQAFVVPMSYKIKDFKKAHKGITSLTDEPALLYNNQSSVHYWIGGRGVQSYTLEVSVNGGKWQTFAKDLDPYDCQQPNGLLSYTGPDMEKGKTYRYRIISYFEDGSKTVSEPGNETSLFESKEMFLDAKGNYAGGFEQGGLTGNGSEKNSNGWYELSHWESPFAEFVKDKSIAYEGEYCLHYAPSKGIGSMGQYASNMAFNLELDGGAMYEISFMSKGTMTTGFGSLTVRDYDNQNLCWSNYTAADEWTSTDPVRFTTPSDGKVKVVFMSTGETDMDIYIDNLIIREVR